MNDIISVRIQIISIVISLCFLAYIGWLIVKGKLREEYSIVWVVGAFLLILFSIWRDGLEVMAKLLGVYTAPNLVFMVAIFGILIYLLHISVVVSGLHDKNKKLSQEIALLKNKLEKETPDNSKG
jgi:hypothetical protein